MSFQSFAQSKRPADVLDGNTMNVQLLMSKSHLFSFNIDFDTVTDPDTDSDRESETVQQVKTFERVFPINKPLIVKFTPMGQRPRKWKR